MAIEKEELIQAIKDNNFVLAQQILKDSFGIDINISSDINAKINDGSTALIWAIANGHTDIAKELLQRTDIDINAQDNDGNTALSIATYNHNTEIEEELFKHPKIDIDVNMQDENGNTALILAIINDDLEFTIEMLQYPKTEVNMQNKNGQTALIWAIEKGYAEIAMKLLQHPNIDVNLQTKYGNTALILASEKGITEIAMKLLQHPNIDVNLQDKNGYTALIFAIEGGHNEIAMQLLQRKDINFNLQDEDRDTALILAIKKGHTDIAMQLLQYPNIDVNLQDENGNTALTWVSEKGYNELAIQLLQHPNIDVNLQDKYGYTALILAIEGGHIEIAMKLLQHPNIDVNLHDNYGQTALIWAIYNGNTELAMQLLQHLNIDVNLQDENANTALILAIKKGYTEIAMQILQRKDINFNLQDEDRDTALILAIERDHIEIAMQILQHPNIDVNLQNTNGNTALILAIQKGLTDIAMNLLQHPKINVNLQNINGNTALILAIYNGNTELAMQLLQNQNIDVNLQDKNGNTALIFAIYNGNTELAMQLLQNQNIDVNLQDKNGNTALIFAIEKGHTEIAIIAMQILQHPNIDVNLQDKNGKTALICAVNKGLTDITMQILQNQNIDVNMQNKNGQTALIWAIQKGHIEIAMQLLQNQNIDVNLQDKNGNTALIFAIEKGHTEIAMQILQHPKIDIDVNMQDENGNTALILAIKKDHTDIAMQILQHPNIDVNLQNKHGSTALTWVSEKGYTEIAIQLLQHPNIDVNLQNKNGHTALIWAIEKGHNEIAIQLLQRKDINFNLQDEDRNTAFTLALERDHIDIAMQILQHPNIDVNLQNINGKTALIWAIEKGHTDIVQALLQHTEIDVNAKNNNGDTALTLAIRNGRTDIAKELLQHADIDVQSIKGNSVALLLNLIYSDLSSYEHIKDNINTYIFANIGNILSAKQIKENDKLLITERLIQNLRNNNLQLKYSQIAPYNVDIETFKKLTPFFETPQKTVIPFENPIIIASRAHDFPLIEYAYDHKEEQPWVTFWQQAGDENNSILEYFLSVDSPPLNDKNKQIFSFILNNFEMVKNINYETIYTNEHHNFYKKTLLKKFSKTKNSIFKLGNKKNAVNNWLNALLNIQKIMKSITKYRKNYSQSAHDEKTASKALEKSEAFFSTELNNRYYELLPNNTKIDQAMLDLRLLVLKQLIESKPIYNSKYYSGWQKLINVLQLQDYSETTSDGKLRTFAEFKNIIFSTANKLVIDSILNGKTPEKCDQIILENIKEIRSILIDHNKLSLDPNIAGAWKAIDPHGHEQSKQNFAGQKVKQFVLFCMLLATEDINTLINNCENANDLLKLMTRSMSGNSDQVRRELFNNIINQTSNQDLENLKEKVKACLLEDQQLMGATVVTESVLALNDKSCSTGILTRFADNVLGPHYKYSLLNSEDALLTDRIEEINKYMCVKFSDFVEQKVLDILLNRLNAKNSQKTPKKSTTSKLLNYSYNKLLGLKKNKLSIIAAPKLLDFSKIKPKTIAELKVCISKLDVDAQKQVLNTLFSVTATNTIKDYTCMSSDPDIAKLFDALFSVNADNWWKLYINDCAIEKYSSLLAKTPNEMTSKDKIKRDEFDTTYKRAELLTECFKPEKIQQIIFAAINQKDPSCTKLSEKEKQAIEYYSLTIAPPAQLKAIAEKLVKAIDSIPNTINPLIEENTIQHQNDEDKYCRQFKELLSNPPSQEETAKNPMATKIWRNKLDKSLVTAIFFEYWKAEYSKNENDSFDVLNFAEAIDELINNKANNTFSYAKYDDVLDFAKAACTALLSTENQELKATLLNSEIDMPVFDFIKTVPLSDETESKRAEIINSLHKVNDFKIV